MLARCATLGELAVALARCLLSLKLRLGMAGMVKPVAHGCDILPAAGKTLGLAGPPGEGIPYTLATC